MQKHDLTFFDLLLTRTLGDHSLGAAMSRAAVGLGILMGISMGMGMGTVMKAVNCVCITALRSITVHR